MKINEVIVEGWWDDLKKKITGGSTGDPDIAAGLQRFDQNVQGRLAPAFQEWVGLAKNTQLPTQPGEDPQAYAQRRAQYLSSAIKQFADELYKTRLPSGGTRIPTPNFTGNESADLKAAKEYLTGRIKEFFSTINVEPAAAAAPQASTAQQQTTSPGTALAQQLVPQPYHPFRSTAVTRPPRPRPRTTAVAPAPSQPTPPREKYMGRAQVVPPGQLSNPVRRLPR